MTLSCREHCMDTIQNQQKTWTNDTSDAARTPSHLIPCLFRSLVATLLQFYHGSLAVCKSSVLLQLSWCPVVISVWKLTKFYYRHFVFYATIRHNTISCILRCILKLMYSQLSPPHETNRNIKEEKTN